MTDPGIIKRKSEHLSIVTDRDVSHGGSTLLGDVRLLHDALPETGPARIDLSLDFFGKSLAAPLMVTSMTGGAEFAGELNRGLGEVCGELGIPLAVGSQRVMLHHPETVRDFAVREQIGDGVLLGNIGAVQLLEVEAKDVVGLVEAIEADGICVHLNAAQELVQMDGNREFAGITEAIKRLVDELSGRVLVKETGAGLSPAALEKLAETGVSYIDVAGSGGTSWTRVESHREINGDLRGTGAMLADWGVPTAFSVIAARRILPSTATVIASGGIRNGLDVVRAVALGANLAGMARAVLVPFMEAGADGARRFLSGVIDEMRTTMTLCGCSSMVELQDAPRVIGGDLREWIATMGWDEGSTR